MWEDVDGLKKKLVEFDYKSGHEVESLSDLTSETVDNNCEVIGDEDYSEDDSYYGYGSPSPVHTNGGDESPICMNCNMEKITADKSWPLATPKAPF